MGFFPQTQNFFLLLTDENINENVYTVQLFFSQF